MNAHFSEALDDKSRKPWALQNWRSRSVWLALAQIGSCESYFPQGGIVTSSLLWRWWSDSQHASLLFSMCSAPVSLSVGHTQREFTKGRSPDLWPSVKPLPPAFSLGKISFTESSVLACMVYNAHMHLAFKNSFCPYFLFLNATESFIHSLGK